MLVACRRVAHLALPAFLLAAALAVRPAAADEWVEPKFDPPVGSQWTVTREVNEEGITAGRLVGYTCKETALLTVEEKTADGFVFNYARQNSSCEGDPSTSTARRAFFEAQKGLVTRIATDASGKPVRVLNFDEFKENLKKGLDAQLTASPNPAIRSRIRQLADRLVKVDDKHAAEVYFDDMMLLAVAQNTGLKSGGARSSDVSEPNPLSDDLNKTRKLSVVKADPTAGTVRYLVSESYDTASVKAFVADTGKRMASAANKSDDIERVLKTTSVEASAQGQFDVAGGMTREVRRQEVMSVRTPGSHNSIVTDVLMTVSPYPPEPARTSAAPVAMAPLTVAPVATPVAVTPAAVTAVTK